MLTSQSANEHKLMENMMKIPKSWIQLQLDYEVKIPNQRMILTNWETVHKNAHMKLQYISSFSSNRISSIKIKLQSKKHSSLCLSAARTSDATATSRRRKLYTSTATYMTTFCGGEYNLCIQNEARIVQSCPQPVAPSTSGQETWGGSRRVGESWSGECGDGMRVWWQDGRVYWWDGRVESVVIGWESGECGDGVEDVVMGWESGRYSKWDERNSNRCEPL